MEQEIWKPMVLPYDGTGRYKISSHGRVLSTVRNSPKILTPRAGNCDYVFVMLRLPDERGKLTSRCLGVSRLVALHFVPNPDPENLPYVDHIDHDPANNHYKNLQWIDLKNNVRRSQAFYYEIYHEDFPEDKIYPASRREVCEIVGCSANTVTNHAYRKTRGRTQTGWYINAVPKTGKERWFEKNFVPKMNKKRVR